MKPSDRSTGSPAKPFGAATLAYRPDIDGLRAVAVIPVCLFHYGIGPFSGGFAGVDVFFVISGYLMAELIGKDLDAKRFSFRRFYERRVRRIFPALFALLLFCTVAATLVVPPKLFYDFGRTLIGTVFFSSNILFALNSSNYFDPPTGLNPLLHTWSLAVEEQFYILFPVYLALVWRTGARARLVITGILTLVSLAIGAWSVDIAPTAAFYLLPSRAWELLLGAMLSVWKSGRDRPTREPSRSRWISEFGSGAGLCLVGFSFFAFNSETPFPGFAALAPCVGTALLLYSCASGQSVVARLLSLRPVTGIGKISYSLYLWHWPLIVFAQKYVWFSDLGPIERVAVLATALIMSGLSWRYVERPFRQHVGAISTRVVFFGAAASMAVFALAGYAAEASAGWQARFPGLESVGLEAQIAQEQKDIGWAKRDRNACFAADIASWGGERCFLTLGRPNNALLWGDSFANSYAYGLFRNQQSAFNVLQYTSPQCPPIFGYEAASRPQCGPFNRGVESLIKHYKINTVVLAANWNVYLVRRKIRLSDISATALRLNKIGVKSILIGQSPEFAFSYPDEYFYGKFGPNQSGARFFARAEVGSGLKNALRVDGHADEFFDPMAVLCRDSECMFREDRNYVVFDYGHYTNYGSLLMARALLGQTSLGVAARH